MLLYVLLVTTLKRKRSRRKLLVEKLAKKSFEKAKKYTATGLPMWSPTKEKVKKIRRRGRTGRTDRRREEELVVLEAVWSWFWRQSGAGKNKFKKKGGSGSWKQPGAGKKNRSVRS